MTEIVHTPTGERFADQREKEQQEWVGALQASYEHGYADGVEWATKQNEALLAVHEEASDLWEVFEFNLRACIGNTQYVLMKEKLQRVGSKPDHKEETGPSMDHRGNQWPFAGCQCKACLSTAVNLARD